MHPIIKHAALPVARGRLFGWILTQLEKMDRGQPNLLRVLTYHRVDEPEARPALDPTLLSATPAAFDEQMRILAAQYHVVAMGEVLEACRGGRPLPPRAVLITFDDAYVDFAEHAWPTLCRYGLPATLFVPTAYPDQPQRAFWWDRLYQAFQATQREDDLETPLGWLPLDTTARRTLAFRSLKTHVKRLPHDEAMPLVDRLCNSLKVLPGTNPILGWDALRRLATEGVTLGAHTQTHPLLSRLAPARMADEIQGAFDDLTREVGTVLPVFSYPSGDFNDTVVETLHRLNVGLAVTTSRGINDLAAADPLRLHRIHVGRHTPLSMLRAQLLPLLLRPVAKRGK
jgi:peptidoglycan/xylan/chitin deacetylase (PgdA/CDA1 family)